MKEAHRIPQAVHTSGAWDCQSPGSLWQVNTIKSWPAKTAVIQTGNTEKKISHDINVKWLEDLTTDHSNLLEQPAAITEADIEEKALRSAGPDLGQLCIRKLLTFLDKHLMNQLLTDGTQPGWITEHQTRLQSQNPVSVQLGRSNQASLMIMSGHMAPYFSGTWKHQVLVDRGCSRQKMEGPVHT